MRARQTVLVALTAAFAAALALLTPTTATATQANTSVMVRNCDGRGEVFYLDDDGRLWHYWEFTAGGQDWSQAQALGGGGRLIYDQVSAERNKDCRLEVFGVGTNKAGYHIWQLAGGGWSPFSSLGGGFDGPLSVAKNEDGRLEVFGVGLNARIYHAYQTTPNGGWSGWYGMNSPVMLRAPYSPAVGNLLDGAITVHAWGADGYEYSNNQIEPNGGWYDVWV